MKHKNVRYKKESKRGSTLIEVLVSILVLVLGALSVLGLQLRTLASTQTSAQRAIAANLISDLGERVRANSNRFNEIGTYETGWNDSPGTTDCTSAACAPNALAQYTIANWKTQVTASLPAAKAAVFLAPAESGVTGSNRRQLGVMVSWRMNERRKETDTNADFAAYTNVFKVEAGAVSCPTDRICHLMYVQL